LAGLGCLRCARSTRPGATGGFRPVVALRARLGDADALRRPGRAHRLGLQRPRPGGCGFAPKDGEASCGARGSERSLQPGRGTAGAAGAAGSEPPAAACPRIRTKRASTFIAQPSAEACREFRSLEISLLHDILGAKASEPAESSGHGDVVRCKRARCRPEEFAFMDDKHVPCRFDSNIRVCSGWTELVEEFEQLPQPVFRRDEFGEAHRDGWVYRGHASHAYRLEPSIERVSRLSRSHNRRTTIGRALCVVHLARAECGGSTSTVKA
jgi:hypothetical protein